MNCKNCSLINCAFHGWKGYLCLSAIIKLIFQKFIIFWNMRKIFPMMIQINDTLILVVLSLIVLISKKTFLCWKARVFGISMMMIIGDHQVFYLIWQPPRFVDLIVLSSFYPFLLLILLEFLVLFTSCHSAILLLIHFLFKRSNIIRNRMGIRNIRYLNKRMHQFVTLLIRILRKFI